MKRVISFVLLYFTVVQVHSQNLVSNGGFESWQKINKPGGWTTALGCLKDSSVILSGSYSCRQSATTDSRELAQVIQVSGGIIYRISFVYKNDTETTGNGCRIWSSWRDIDGNTINDDISLPFLHSGFLKNESWQEYTAEVTAPGNAVYFYLLLRTLPNSITFWEDVNFEENVATGMNEQTGPDILIYPNPAYNYLIISNIHNIQQIDIQSITGIKIWSTPVNKQEKITIPLSDYIEGLYIITLHSQERIYIKKFIKACY